MYIPYFSVFFFVDGGSPILVGHRWLLYRCWMRHCSNVASWRTDRGWWPSWWNNKIWPNWYTMSFTATICRYWSKRKWERLNFKKKHFYINFYFILRERFALRCLHHLSRCPLFFQHRCVILGVEPLLRVIPHLASSNASSLIVAYAVHLLSDMLSK